jgi:hypothetical protein
MRIKIKKKKLKREADGEAENKIESQRKNKPFL